MKTCHRCKLALDISKERHVKVQDNEGKKNLTVLFFHKKCWSDLILNKEKTNKLMDNAFKMFNVAKKKIGLEDEEEVVIK
jgi:hypothetical protein